MLGAKEAKAFNSKIPLNSIKLIEYIKASGYEAYLVGGCVRDLKLGLTPNDWDICTNATPGQVITILKQNKIKCHTVGIEFGTITALMKTQDSVVANESKSEGHSEKQMEKQLEKYEITTYRSEACYSDSRHPDSVKFVSSIADDLSRRDFTINAMAYDPIDCNLIDLFDGRQDLKNKTIRAIGDTKERITEDPLRIMRALRFAIKLDASIERCLKATIHEHKEKLNIISKERITAELEKILTSGKPVSNIFSEFSDIIGVIIPELITTFNFNQRNKYHTRDVYKHMLTVVDLAKTNKFEIKLAALLHDVGKPDSFTVDEHGFGHFYGHPEVSYQISTGIINNRLRLSNEQKDLVLQLIRYHDIVIASTTASVKRALNKHGEVWLRDWFILKQADMDDHVYLSNDYAKIPHIPELEELLQGILDENACFKLKDLKINGNILMTNLDIKPGKQLGVILNTLFEEVLDEKLSNETEVLLSRACDIYKSIS